MKHGTESGYARGCRCDECKRGHREYNAARRARIKALDAEVERINANLTPSKPIEWEVQRDLRLERDALRLRVAELEAQVDRMIDASLAAETRSFPSGLGRKRGRKAVAR